MPINILKLCRNFCLILIAISNILFKKINIVKFKNKIKFKKNQTQFKDCHTQL